MVGVVFIGAPCSGKSTLAKAIADKIKVPYTSSGDVARKLARDHVDVAKTLDNGGMAPEIIMRGEIAKTIMRARTNGDDAIILDGFPRFLGQYEWLVSSFPEMKFLCIHVDTRTGTLFERSRIRGRNDDSLDAFMHRMRYYLENTMPIILSANNVCRIYGDGDTVTEIRNAIDKIWGEVRADSSKV